MTGLKCPGNDGDMGPEHLGMQACLFDRWDRDLVRRSLRTRPAGDRRPIALVRGPFPQGLDALLPGLDLRSPRDDSQTQVNVLLNCESRAADKHRPSLMVTQGILQIPPYRSGLPWLSAAVVGVGASVAQPEDSLPADIERGFILADRLIRERLGGTCWADAPPAQLLTTIGDGLAIVAACRRSASNAQAMLHRACASVGAGRTLLLLSHDCGRGTQAPEMIRLEAQRLGCRIVDAPVDPWPLLDCASELHVAAQCGCGSSLATLARLSGVAVHVAGSLSQGKADAFEEAAVGLVARTGYADPFSRRTCTAEHALDLVALWQNVCTANRRVAACVGVQFWKKRRISQFLHSGTRTVRLCNGPKALSAATRSGGAIATWASRVPAGLEAGAAAANISLLRIEDGFLRSVGLGSNFNLPCSIVVDGAGLYYDPTRPSDLETLLASHAFPPALLARANAVVRRLVDAGTTKYNTGGGSLPSLPQDGRRRILVPGQVADDLSVVLGQGAATGNADLLARVRTDHPDAFIIYKPHPDVEAGHRPGALDDAEVLRHADVVARDGAMGSLIRVVDEVHTMTSLAGFEALLRGRKVVAWGRPFYAGWGLTDDRAPIARRSRTLRLEQLAAGVLLLYPRYVDPVTGLPCPIEVLMDRMADPKVWKSGLLVRLRQMQGRAALVWRRRVGRPAMTAATRTEERV